MKSFLFQLFTATGCTRCNIVKAFLKAQGIEFEELDIKADGQGPFKAFYKENRKQVYRGNHGVEFPVLYTGEAVSQGVGPILARLAAGSALDSCVATGENDPGWISRLNSHGRDLDTGMDKKGSPGRAYLDVLRFTKAQGLMVAFEADGRNPGFLDILIREGLIKKLDFILRGPAPVYRAMTGSHLDESDLKTSLNLLDKCHANQIDHRIILPAAGFLSENGGEQFLSPEQAAQAAAFAQEATGSSTHPFFIQAVTPGPELKLQPLPGPALFKYRTQCRRYMVKAEILNF